MDEGKFEPDLTEDLPDLPSDEKLAMIGEMIDDVYAKQAVDEDEEELLKENPKYYRSHFGDSVIKVTFSKDGKYGQEEMTIAQWQAEQNRSAEHAGGE